MARDEAAPFARGETYYNGGPIDTNNLGGPNYEGKEFVMEVNVPDDNTSSDPSGRQVRVRVVRNVSGVNLKPGRVAKYSNAAPYACRVDGYATAVTDKPAGVIDEFLPAGGVPDQDLFYIVVGGPTVVTLAASSPATLAIGDRIVPAAAGSTAVDNLGGRVAKQDLTGATATLGNNIQNAVGIAAAAASTANGTLAAIVRL